MTEPSETLADADARLWAAFAHLGGIVGFLPSLFIRLVFHGRSPEVARESTEALGWQLTWLPVYLVFALLGVIASLVLGLAGTVVVGGVLWLIYLVNVALSIVGFVRTSREGGYRYPLNFRWPK